MDQNKLFIFEWNKKWLHEFCISHIFLCEMWAWSIVDFVNTNMKHKMQVYLCVVYNDYWFSNAIFNIFVIF